MTQHVHMGVSRQLCGVVPPTHTHFMWVWGIKLRSLYLNNYFTFLIVHISVPHS